MSSFSFSARASGLASLIAVGLLAGSQAGCNRLLICGTGTVERDGECVASDSVTGGHCGPGTRFHEESGECRGDLLSDDGGPPIYCGEFTAVTFNDAGIPICTGVGGNMTCDSPPPCPAPAAGKISVCGRIYDTETSLPIDNTPGSDMGASTRVEVRLYDPLGFVADPVGTPPIGSLIYPDSCGYYSVKDVPPPFDGYIAVAVDDDTQDGEDDYWLTGVATTQAPGQTITGFNAFVTKKTTDCLWSMSGMPAGFVDCASTPNMTFAARGIYLPVFIDPTMPKVGPFAGTPVPMVKITQAAATNDMKDWYFTDSDPLTRSMMSPAQDSTGMNGSGLWINGSLVNFSGVGGEPSGCMWPSTLAATPAGVVFVQERIASGGPCDM